MFPLPSVAKKSLSVAIIGGGSAGLVMCRHLMSHPDTFSVTIYEQTGSIGGTWVYTDHIGKDEYGSPIHSSMYKNLRTNLPKEVMAYLDFPFPDGGSSYLHRDDVLQYLCDYCEHFKLRQYIKLFTKVIKVSPLNNTSDKQWLIETENVVSKKTELNYFDAVAICNGHYSVPRYADICGIENFKGKIMHSHDYRVADMFSGQNVLCIGANSSGVDIALEVAEVAKKVVLCHDLPNRLLSPFPENVKEMQWITLSEPTGFHFKNGEFFRTDTLIFCTGYEYSFPFLSPECDILVRDHRVCGVYQHLVNIAHPTMAILSVPFTTVPFVVSDVQAQFFKEVLKNPNLLPPESEMRSDTENEILQKSKHGYLPRHFHKFVYKIWDYLNGLSTLANLKPVPLSREKLYQLCFDNRMLNFSTFRELNYTMTDTEVFYR